MKKIPCKISSLLKIICISALIFFPMLAKASISLSQRNSLPKYEDPLLKYLQNSKKILQNSLKQKVECDKGCSVCYQSQEDTPMCVYCVKYFLVEPNTCLKSIDTSNTQCLMFAHDALCQFCLPGYALDLYNEIDTSTIRRRKYKQEVPNSFCFKIDNPKSVIAIANGSFRDNKFLYSACEGGHPSQDRSECVDFPSSSSCRWGALDQHLNVYCFRCKEGYISDGSEIPKCVLDSGELPGCLMKYKGQNICGACDIWDGWYMKYPGVCAKN